MAAGAPLPIELLEGSEQLLAAHARELPQRDDLCGAFCGALALNAAAITERNGAPLDQDAVAIAAGSIVSTSRDPATLPGAETGRRDYRLAIPTIDDAEISGTTAVGVMEAIPALSADALEAIPFSSPWTAATLDGIFDAAFALERPVTLIANFATHHLWGSHASLEQLLAHLLHGATDGPEADWDVGHFGCVFGRVHGPAGTLYAVADTYPALGWRGTHLQPRERLAAAIDRRDKPAGGMLAVCAREDATRIRAGALAAGLHERIWDNGTIAGSDA
jgi:hypothetical protein